MASFNGLGAVRVRQSARRRTYLDSGKKTGWSLNLFDAHGLKKGVLYPSILFLHCSAVLIYRSCSMKYSAEVKHMHPFSSEENASSLHFQNIIESNT